MPRPLSLNPPFGPLGAGALSLFGALALGACDALGGGTGPGGVSEGEAHELDEAAKRLDAQQLPDDAIPADAVPQAGQPGGDAAGADDAAAADGAPEGEDGDRGGNGR